MDYIDVDTLTRFDDNIDMLNIQFGNRNVELGTPFDQQRPQPMHRRQ